MMDWNLEFIKAAERDIRKLDVFIRRKIIGALELFTKNFGTDSPAPLHGNFKDFYKIRIGDWRVIYKINWDKKIITVCYINRRDKVYKNKR